MNAVVNILAFAVLALLWAGFAAAALLSPATLDLVWQTFRGLPVVVQILVGLIVLPVALGLWIWQSNWPFLVRILLVLGLAIASLYMFLPKKS